MSVRPPELDDNVAPLFVAKIAQPRPKCFGKFGQAIGRKRAYVADAKNLGRRLRPCCKWPCRRAAEQRDDGAAI